MLEERGKFLETALDIDDVNVGDLILYRKQYGIDTFFSGMIIKKDGTGITVADVFLDEFGGTNQTLNDLFNSPKVRTFTVKMIPDFIYSMEQKQQTTTVDPDVKAQTDTAMEAQKENPVDAVSQLNADLDATKDKSANDVFGDFLDNINCKG